MSDLEKTESSIIKTKSLIGVGLVVSVILLIPLIAMGFTNEVNWTLADFVVAGALLFGAGILCEFVLRRVTKFGLRIAICLAILATLLLVWAELAVGILGTPLSGS